MSCTYSVFITSHLLTSKITAALQGANLIIGPNLWFRVLPKDTLTYRLSDVKQLKKSYSLIH